MINKILEAQQIDDDDFTRLMEDLIESSKKGKAQHHKDHKSFFMDFTCKTPIGIQSKAITTLKSGKVSW